MLEHTHIMVDKSKFPKKKTKKKKKWKKKQDKKQLLVKHKLSRNQVCKEIN